MERAHPLPPRDPISGGPLVITEVEAVESGVTIRGRFEVPRFARLSPEQGRYLETFLRCRGMLNSVEKELGISYPTARARLDAVLKALDLHAVREEPAVPASAELAPPKEEAEPPAEAEKPEELTTGPDVAPSAYEEPDYGDATGGDSWFEPEPEPPATSEPPAEEESTTPQAEGPRYTREEILSMLERGEISVEDVKKELGKVR